MPDTFKLRLRFSGHEIDKRGLDFYDGTYSLQGLAQALQIVVHAGLNKQIVSRSTALKNSKIIILPPLRGSIIFDIIAVIEQYPATSAIAGMAFYDFVKYSLSRAVGHFYVEPEKPSVRRLAEGDETFLMSFRRHWKAACYVHIAQSTKALLAFPLSDHDCRWSSSILI